MTSRYREKNEVRQKIIKIIPNGRSSHAKQKIQEAHREIFNR
jgi:hypothetical protein